MPFAEKGADLVGVAVVQHQLRTEQVGAIVCTTRIGAVTVGAFGCSHLAAEIGCGVIHHMFVVGARVATPRGVPADIAALLDFLLFIHFLVGASCIDGTEIWIYLDYLAA